MTTQPDAKCVAKLMSQTSSDRDIKRQTQTETDKRSKWIKSSNSRLLPRLNYSLGLVVVSKVDADLESVDSALIPFNAVEISPLGRII